MFLIVRSAATFVLLKRVFFLIAVFVLHFVFRKYDLNVEVVSSPDVKTPTYVDRDDLAGHQIPSRSFRHEMSELDELK